MVAEVHRAKLRGCVEDQFLIEDAKDLIDASQVPDHETGLH